MDRYPESADDGDIAEEIDDPETRADIEVEDVNGHHGTTYYAVYGFDGSDWLSWTVEGWNAATVELEGGEVPLEDQFDSGGVYYRPLSGCACDAAGPGPGVLVGLLAAAGIRRRRALAGPKRS
jgi:MYXO-CTERM domain-containing protein